MKFEQFMKEAEAAVQNEIPEELREEITVEVTEVMKTNDEILHGLRMSIPGKNSMPTVYLEDCYREFEEGMDLKQISEMIIELSVEAYKNAPEYADISLKYEDIEDKLVVQLIDGDLNKERLKELVYKPLAGSFVMIAYIIIAEERGGYMRTAVSAAMAEQFNYDIEALMDRAFLNTIQRYKPVLGQLKNTYNMQNLPKINPLEQDFKEKSLATMYFLSNEMYQNGACVMFYPFVAERVAETLDDNYYVLPSSLHEVIIVPAAMGITVQEMQSMVRKANSTVVEAKDVLSYKVLYYDRTQNTLSEQS